MKRSALRMIVCPDCHDELELEARAEEGAEVMEGSLFNK